MLFNQAPKFLIHFNNGAFIKQLGGKKHYTVRFIQNDIIEFEGTIKKDQWLNTSIKFLLAWTIQIIDEKDKLVIEHTFNLSNKKIRINIDSKSLGDTLAWVPQIADFAKQYPNTEIYVSQFLSGIGFEKAYPRLQFIDPDTELSDTYATYRIGYNFDNIIDNHPNDPRTLTLGQVASDILGIAYREIRPTLSIEDRSRKRNRPYVCIATQSTAGCKLWQHKNGWQMVVDYLNSIGLRVVVIQKEASYLNNVIDKTGNLPLQERMTELLHCEFFIGLGSGLSWLAWALKKRVILISGFSLPFSEFHLDCTRIINTKVCHGCWNSTDYHFDRDDWDWCPNHKNTHRKFECSKAITPHIVYQAINRLIQNNNA